MSGYACPCCGDISEVFSKGGGEKMAKEEGVHFFGKIPIDTKLVELLDEVSKGNIPVGEDVVAQVDQVSLSEGEQTQRHTVDHNNSVPQNQLDSSEKPLQNTASKMTPFPLLDRYLETTSSKLWRVIAEDLLSRLEERKRLAQAELDDDDDHDDEDDEDEDDNNYASEHP
jgi:hypothetical protein